MVPSHVQTLGETPHERDATEAHRDPKREIGNEVRDEEKQQEAESSPISR
jgi:hypothetical protein